MVFFSGLKSKLAINVELVFPPHPQTQMDSIYLKKVLYLQNKINEN